MIWPGHFNSLYIDPAAPKFPADTAPRSQVKSRYACRSDDCEHGPSTGHKLTDGYCKECRDG